MNTSNKIRIFSIFWSLFIGIGALLGSLMMFIDPSGDMWGMTPMLPLFQKLPYPGIFFQNFIFPGIALLLVNGVTNFISFTLMRQKHRYAALSAMFCGIILILWITIQFFIFEFNFMSTLYFFFGILQFWTGLRYWNIEKQNAKEMIIKQL